MSQRLIPKSEEPDEMRDFLEWARLQKSEGTANRYASSLRAWVRFCRAGGRIDWIESDDDESDGDENDGDEGDDESDDDPDPIDILTDDERIIAKFLLKRSNGDFSEKTATPDRAALSQFYQYHGDYDQSEPTPVDRADVGSWSAESRKSEENRGDDIHWISRDQAEKLVEPENQQEPTLRNRVLLKLLLQTGIRAGELTTIRIGEDPDWQDNDLGDIDREEREIEIIDQKNDDSRVVYYQASLDSLLRLWIEAERPNVFYASESPYLFPTRNSPQIDPQRVNEIVKLAAEEAGIQKTYSKSADGRELNAITCHVLRHTFAMLTIKGRGDGGTGADALFVQQQLGHSDISTTIEKYVHQDNDAQQEAIQQHGPTF